MVKHIDPFRLHEEVKGMYSWDDVASRTEKVYDRMTNMEKLPLISRMKKSNNK